MASNLAKNMQSDHVLKKRQRMQTLLWLLMALIFGALTAFLWVIQASIASPVKVVESPDTQETMATAKFETPSHITALHELDSEVEPISFDPLVRDMRRYPDEFIDKQFLKSNAGKWTVQVMDVSEYRIITEYLNNREDRDKFVFFRYRDENDQARYILLYDVYPTAQMAMGSSKVTDFSLPANIRVIPEEISRYLSVIENYELSEPMQSLEASAIRKINLQPTRREMPVQAPKEEPDTQSQSTSDTDEADKEERKVTYRAIDQDTKSNQEETDREDTQVSTVENENTQTSDTSKNSTNAPKKPTAQKEATPKQTSQKEASTPAKSNSTQKEKSSANKVDPIKQLIEEKTN